MIITFWKGVFVADHQPGDEQVLKKAGFVMHEPTLCESSTCRGCRAHIGRRFFSGRVEHATRLKKFCNQRALTVMKDHLTKLARSRAVDADIKVPAPPGLAYKPYQKAGIAYAVSRKDTLFGDDMGLGKALSLDTKLLTPNGWILMKDVRIGDLIEGPDGLPHNVTGIYPQGTRPVYRVTFQDGASLKCDGNHLWQITTPVRKKRKSAPLIMTTDELRQKGLVDKAGNHRYFIPLAKAFNHNTVEHLLPPYLMGYLLGNGGLSQDSVRITIPDQETVQRLTSLLPTGYKLSQQTPIDFLIVRLDGKRHNNIVLDEMRRIGLMGHLSNNKYIPNKYFWDSPKNRLALLQGLIDSDGHARPLDGNVEYSSSSPKLAQDVQQLIWSLGGTAKIRQKKTKCQPSYRMSIQLPNEYPPCQLERKLHNCRKRTKYLPYRTIVNISLVGSEPVQCISIDSPDHLYVAQDFIVTHNTVEALGFINYVRPKTVLVICPATLALNWLGEAKKWLVGPYHYHLPKTGEDAVPNTSTQLVVITNYEKVVGQSRQGEHHHTALSKSLHRQWDVGIFDEAQALKNPEALRTQVVLGEGGLYEHCRRGLFLTGTPMENRPIEIWPIAASLCPARFGDWWDFARRYCGLHQEERGKKAERIMMPDGSFKVEQRSRKVWVADGSSNHSELQQRLRTSFMIRRLKSDVLKELPPKRRQLIVLSDDLVDWGKYPEFLRWKQTYQTQFDDALARLEAAKTMAEYKRAVKELNTITVPFTETSDVRHKSALLKLPSCIKLADELLASGGLESLVIFGHHRDILQQTHQHYGEKSCVIYGDTPMKDRMPIVSEFQEGRRSVFIGGLKAAGTGITLTRANTLVFFEGDWNPATMRQAEDRLCRIGQLKMVHVIHPVLNGSLDANMVKMTVTKQNVIDRMLDEVPEEIRMRAGFSSQFYEETSAANF